MTKQTYDAIVTAIEDLQVEGVENDGSDHVYEEVYNRLNKRNIQVEEQELCDVLADYM